MKKEEGKEEQTLLDAFKQGDRVVQVIIDSDGYKKEYSGVIKKILDHSMAVYWDTINGEPIPNLHEVFCIFHESEVFYGNKNASPIKKEE